MKPGTKNTRVEVVVEKYNMSQMLDIDHAERLLRMPNNGGWTLPENSNFEFDLANGIKTKTASK